MTTILWEITTKIILLNYQIKCNIATKLNNVENILERYGNEEGEV